MSERQRYLKSVEAALSAGGEIAAALPGFVGRDGQRALAVAIGEAIADRGTLVAEAGTGIGKTFAYLVPSLLSGGMILISTGTRNLQDQLFRRDLPVVKDALKLGARVALLKGRSNYVCRYHLRRNLSEGRFESRADIAILHRIDRFAAISASGDRSEVPGVPEDSAAWSRATSTRENCLGQDCPDVSDCFLMKARQAAQDADVVVVNHHLLCADLALKDEGIGELLPTAQAIIFDEAHQLPEIATQFFGRSISSRQILDLSRDVLKGGLSEAPDAAEWIELTRAMELRLKQWRAALPTAGRFDRDRIARLHEFGTATSEVLRGVRSLREPLQRAAERGRELMRLAARALELERMLAAWQDAVSGDSGAEFEVAAPLEPGASTSAPASDRLPFSESVLWVEASASALTLNATPLSLAEGFSKHRSAHPRAWIFLSATLAVADDFSHFTSALGLGDARCERWGSPFDTRKNGVLYVPRNCGDPADPSFADRVADSVWPLIVANRGRAFVLCTSLRMVEQLASRLREKSSGSADPIEFLVQGQAARSELIARFRQGVAPVLLGSASFWEGVDVVGDQLSLVIIDKLPFAPPDDPVLRARSDALKRAGGDAFRSIQIPAAAMALKQGAGRLIRSEQDSGLLVICDERLVTKSYGKRFRESLPDMPLTRSDTDALSWISRRVAPGAS